MKLVKPATNPNDDRISNCVIDFEDTAFELGETLTFLEFQDQVYQNVTPLTPVFGSKTLAVCTVGAITKSL